MKTNLLFALALSLSFATNAFALGKDINCSNCDISGTVSSVAGTSAEPSFPSDICIGTVTKTKEGDGVTEYQTYEATLDEGDTETCPLNAEVDPAKDNILHSENSAVLFSGVSSGLMQLVADNGKITVQNSGNNIKATAKQGNLVVSDSSGIFDLKSLNGSISMTNVSTIKLKSRSDNGNIKAARLKILSRRTATVTADNGSVNISGLSGYSNEGGKIQPVKVKVIMRAENGTARDLRTAAKKTMTEAESRKAAKLIVRAINGNVTIR